MYRYLYLHSGGGGNFVLSSSLAGYQTVVGVGAPMVPHGYGCFYNIRDDRYERTSISYLVFTVQLMKKYIDISYQRFIF